jgi:hypothetical protein
MHAVLSLLMRCVPVLGLAAHWFQRSERLRVADDEDAAYKAMIEAMDTSPHFAGAQRARETQIIIGQFVGYCAASAMGVLLHVLQAGWVIVVPATWGIALTLDAVGARIFASLHDRKAQARSEALFVTSEYNARTDEVGPRQSP